jgi:hypothetical protein
MRRLNTHIRHALKRGSTNLGRVCEYVLQVHDVGVSQRAEHLRLPYQLRVALRGGIVYIIYTRDKYGIDRGRDRYYRKGFSTLYIELWV